MKRKKEPLMLRLFNVVFATFIIYSMSCIYGAFIIWQPIMEVIDISTWIVPFRALLVVVFLGFIYLEFYAGEEE
jgi:cytochrome c-type biogenesis protein CcmH/NrfF